MRRELYETASNKRGSGSASQLGAFRRIAPVLHRSIAVSACQTKKRCDKVRKILVVAIICVGWPAIAGWFGPPIALPGVSKAYHGHYTFRREVSAFKPCDLDERWWVHSGSELLREQLTWPNGIVGGELYIEVEGIVSKRGSFGHLGAYDRQLEIQKVSFAGAPRKTCSQ
jgi:hypothetical protein